MSVVRKAHQVLNTELVFGEIPILSDGSVAFKLVIWALLAE